jgi:hypothetical protein
MIIFPVLVREGSIVPADFDPTYIEEMFAIVTIGTGISVATCCFIWPMTATKKLKYVFEYICANYSFSNLFLF